MYSAAFGRLCVETRKTYKACRFYRPAAFGRLCVETIRQVKQLEYPVQPPSGGCVLKLHESSAVVLITKAAAFGRLCVETSVMPSGLNFSARQPPSGGCVLKLSQEKI